MVNINLFTTTNITTSTTLNNTLSIFLFVNMQATNKMIKLMKKAIIPFSKRLLCHGNLNLLSFWATECFLEEFRKTPQ